MQHRTTVLGLIGLILQLAACSSGSSGGPSNLPPPPSPPPPPTGANVQQVFTQLPGFASPVEMVQAPGDSSRWYVVEQDGVIRMFDNDPNVTTSSVFIDIDARVDSGPGEAGLLGLAFHPDFANNNEVFLSYTAGSPFRSVVSRFMVDPSTGVADPSSESVIIEVPQPQGNHNGGQIAFGPDGFLYIALGDGGGGGDPGEHGQNTSTLLGSILRLDVNGAAPYLIPASNPFANNTNCVGGSGQMPCPEIYAFGLRNPWRMSFDSQTGELWAGDVGQNAWEEVDRIELGLNYGWDEREGAHCYEPASGCDTMNVDPITEYGHSVGQSVTGGYVYRGAMVPSLQGLYVFGDFVSGRIWTVPANSPQGQVTPPTELADTGINISSFAQGADGEVYVVDYGGAIYQIVP